MPKSVEQREARCLEWMNRTSPTSSPHSSDNEDNDTEVGGGGDPHASDDEERGAENGRRCDDDIVATLLGLGSGEVGVGDDEHNLDAC